MRKFVAFVLGAAVVGSVALALPADAATRAATTVTIAGTNGDYFGTVSSPRPLKCAQNRKILVYKQLGATQVPSEDQQIGSDNASNNGGVYQWSIGNSGFKKGKFYALARRTPECRRDTSPTITR